MKIVIPMTGTGDRFRKAGYHDPKPLIKVDDRPMIAHVLDMFPGETNFHFICRDEHLDSTHLSEVLRELAPEGVIHRIAGHKKGPVYAVQQIVSELDDEEEVIVCYCDFSAHWDYADFLRHTRLRGADGAIVAYKGFHPHMLGSTHYAFIREENQWMLEIKEKSPFTDNRMDEYASNGLYYFKHGRYVKKYFHKLMAEKIDLNGEYYVSLVYNLMQQDKLAISVYEVPNMLQWGTPEDLEQFQSWSKIFQALVKPTRAIPPLDRTVNLIPLAGRGSRFQREGYPIPKPLIPVSGTPMIVQAVRCLPPAQRHVFVALQEHLDSFPLKEALDAYSTASTVVALDWVTEGQAETCVIGLKGENHDHPLIIGACDNGMLWNRKRYQALMDDPTVDAIVWTFRHHPSSKRNPHMYGWVDVDEAGAVKNVSVKVPISDNPAKDHAIVGSFTFKRAADFIKSVERLRKKNIRVNGEFYVDSCINELVQSGKKVVPFEVDHYICWGTPDDLRTFEYWQRFFHDWPHHPYDTAKDRMMQEEVLCK